MKPWMLAAGLFALALGAGLVIELWVPRAHLPAQTIDPNSPLTDDECGALLNQMMKLQFSAADELARRAGKSEIEIEKHRTLVQRDIEADPHRLELVASCKQRTSRPLYACVMRAVRYADLAECDRGLAPGLDGGR